MPRNPCSALPARLRGGDEFAKIGRGVVRRVLGGRDRSGGGRARTASATRRVSSIQYYALAAAGVAAQAGGGEGWIPLAGTAAPSPPPGEPPTANRRSPRNASVGSAPSSLSGVETCPAAAAAAGGQRRGESQRDGGSGGQEQMEHAQFLGQFQTTAAKRGESLTWLTYRGRSMGVKRVQQFSLWTEHGPAPLFLGPPASRRHAREACQRKDAGGLPVCCGGEFWSGGILCAGYAGLNMVRGWRMARAMARSLSATPPRVLGCRCPRWRGAAYSGLPVGSCCPAVMSQRPVALWKRLWLEAFVGGAAALDVDGFPGSSGYGSGSQGNRI